MFPNKRWQILYLIERRGCLISIVKWLSNERLLVIACGTVNHERAKWNLIFLIFAAHSFSESWEEEWARERERGGNPRVLNDFVLMPAYFLLSWSIVSLFPHNHPGSIVLYYAEIFSGLKMSENSSIFQLLLPVLQSLLAIFKCYRDSRVLKFRSKHHFYR